jgi:hypothetical protein
VYKVLGLPSIDEDGFPSFLGSDVDTDDSSNTSTPTATEISDINAPSFPTIPSSTAIPDADIIAAAQQQAQASAPFPNASTTIAGREAEDEALDLKLPTVIPTLPTVVPVPRAGSGCNTNNSQCNQCSTGIPYCCSLDGDRG